MEPNSPAANTGLIDGLSFGKPADIDPAPGSQPPPAGDSPPPADNTPKIDLIPRTDPPADPNNPPADQTPKYTPEEFAKILFGETASYKTVDEFKGLRIGDTLSEHAQLKPKFTELEKTNQSLQDRLAITNSPKYQNALKFAHFAEETKIDDPIIYRKIESLDPAIFDKDPITALVLKDVCENPSLIESMPALKESYMREYKLGDYAEEMVNADGSTSKVESDLDKVKLKRDALAATKFLTGLKDKIASFKPEVEDVSGKREQNLTAWAPVAKEMVTKYCTQLECPVTEIKGIPIKSSYQLTAQDLAFAETKAMDYVKERNLPLTKENVQVAYGKVMADIAIAHRKEEFQAFGEAILAAAEQRIKSKYSNFSWDGPIAKPGPSDVHDTPAGGVQLETIQQRDTKRPY